MKIKKTTRLTLDSQNRLVAYSTAAGLGAFFAGQNAEAQTVLSSVYASYPVSLHVGSGSAGYNYLNIDGGAGPELNIDASATRVTLGKGPGTSGPNGTVSTPSTVTVFNNTGLNPSKDGYLIPWTSGLTIGTAVGPSPTYKSSVADYKNWLAEDSGGKFLFNNFSSMTNLGFAFVSGGNEYFGYMTIQITASDPVAGQTSSFTAVTVDGIYYNETPDTAIIAGASPVPEPSSLALLAVGVAGMAARRIRRASAK